MENKKLKQMKEMVLSIRINSANNQINVALPRRKLSAKDLDKIQRTKSIKFFMVLDG